ncbi:hypothetical protein K474DRAFT_1680908, partial [Panus rudis PR-1116 ss-1]
MDLDSNTVISPPAFSEDGVVQSRETSQSPELPQQNTDGGSLQNDLEYLTQLREQSEFAEMDRMLEQYDLLQPLYPYLRVCAAIKESSSIYKCLNAYDDETLRRSIKSRGFLVIPMDKGVISEVVLSETGLDQARDGTNGLLPIEEEVDKEHGTVSYPPLPGVEENTNIDPLLLTVSQNPVLGRSKNALLWTQALSNMLSSEVLHQPPPRMIVAFNFRIGNGHLCHTRFVERVPNDSPVLQGPQPPEYSSLLRELIIMNPTSNVRLSLDRVYRETHFKPHEIFLGVVDHTGLSAGTIISGGGHPALQFVGTLYDVLDVGKPWRCMVRCDSTSSIYQDILQEAGVGEFADRGMITVYDFYLYTLP